MANDLLTTRFFIRQSQRPVFPLETISAVLPSMQFSCARLQMEGAFDDQDVAASRLGLARAGPKNGAEMDTKIVLTMQNLVFDWRQLRMASKLHDVCCC